MKILGSAKGVYSDLFDAYWAIAVAADALPDLKTDLSTMKLSQLPLWKPDLH